MINVRLKRHVMIFGLFMGVFVCFWRGGWVLAEDRKSYVGSKTCMGCHEAEYLRFTTYSKKAASYEHIDKLRKGLTKEEFQACFECHTTGYGKPGGFKSFKETPDARNVGCESCHGPGSLHVETGDSKYIKGNLTRSDCEVCHNKERVEAFNYKPLIYGGAH